MNLKHPLIGSLIVLAGLAGAQAQDIGQHPAVFAPRALPGIDPSTFIVGHPAGPAPRDTHANHEHPAIATKAAAPRLDTDRFLVQPPATTRWSPASDAGAATTFAHVPVIVR